MIVIMVVIMVTVVVMTVVIVTWLQPCVQIIVYHNFDLREPIPHNVGNEIEGDDGKIAK